MRTLVSGLVAATLAAGCALPAPRVSPNGRTTMLHTGSGRVNGELIAVSLDTVWMLTRPGGTLAPFASANIVRLDVQRHAMGATRTIQAMSLVGLATGVLLSIACSSVDDASCGAVIPATMIPYVGLGAIFGLFNFESAWLKYGSFEVIRARPYARFPQGLPDTLRKTARP